MKNILMTTLILVFIAAVTPASAIFTDNGDGTVTEDVTGLMWTKNSDSTFQSKDAACAHCANLAEQEFAGYNDWRAPTIEELQTTIDYRYNSPAGDENLFNGTTGGSYLSSTQQTSFSGSYWTIDSSSGAVINWFGWPAVYMRCVRGNMVKTTFVDNGDGETVTSSDGLVWSKQTSDTMMSWVEANAYCSNLEVGGMRDWFLPTVEELRTLVAFDKAGPAADTSLFEIAPDTAYYWTATELSGDTETQAWQIAFLSGYTEPLKKTITGWVRCAHEAPPENFCECPDCPVCEPEIVEVEKIVEVPAECPVCPTCEPEIVEVPVEKIVYVESSCSCGDCNFTGLTSYLQLKEKRAELYNAIKELKKCSRAVTRAMYKARKAERKAWIAKKKAAYLAKKNKKK